MHPEGQTPVRPQEPHQEQSPQSPRQERRSQEVQRGTLKEDFSEGWKKFKKEAGVVFLGDAIRERSDAAREKGVITFKPDKPEVWSTYLTDLEYHTKLTQPPIDGVCKV